MQYKAVGAIYTNCHCHCQTMFELSLLNSLEWRCLDRIRNFCKLTIRSATYCFTRSLHVLRQYHALPTSCAKFELAAYVYAAYVYADYVYVAYVYEVGMEKYQVWQEMPLSLCSADGKLMPVVCTGFQRWGERAVGGGILLGTVIHLDNGSTK